MKVDELQPETKVIHELSIDTAKGNRQFELHFGNLLALQTDLWVTTVYHDNGGELFISIKRLLSLGDNYNERKIIPLPNGGYIGFINHPKQKLLTVNLNKLEGTAIPRDEFQQIIQATFSAIAALTYEGHSFRDISIPVIGKKGLQQKEYEGSFKWLIHYAVNYLKFSNSTEKIKYFVHLEEDVPVWEGAITQLFGRNAMDSPNIDLFVANTKGKIVQLIDSFPTIERTFVREALDRINLELKKNTATDYVVLLAEVDRLADFILKDLYKLDGISSPSILPGYRLPFKQVADLQRQEPISDWFFNYFITIRTLRDKNYFLSESNSGSNTEEKVNFLLIIQRIISFYYDFYKQFYN